MNYAYYELIIYSLDHLSMLFSLMKVSRYLLVNLQKSAYLVAYFLLGEERGGRELECKVYIVVQYD